MREGGAEARAWLALSQVPGLGPARQRRLWEHFGSAAAALAAPAGQWRQVVGSQVARPAAAQARWAAAQWQRARQLGGWICGLGEAAYPELLRHVADPPPALFGLGASDWSRPCVAIVGTRRASPYGLGVARQLGQALARRGICVVSGMALGIDAAAHEGALAAGGRTVAVLGCGADQVYPAAHASLYRRILRAGAALAEMPWGALPDKGSFPRRNRIISGLSLGVVVVEAAARSGALITARCAAEQGREVFAVPGDIGRESSAGCHALLKDGARLVEGVEDVLDELALAPSPAPEPELSGVAARLYALLGRAPRHVDELAREAEVAPAELLGALLQMELEGLVAQLPGQRFARRQ